MENVYVVLLSSTILFNYTLVGAKTIQWFYILMANCTNKIENTCNNKPVMNPCWRGWPNGDPPRVASRIRSLKLNRDINFQVKQTESGRCWTIIEERVEKIFLSNLLRQLTSHLPIPVPVKLNCEALTPRPLLATSPKFHPSPYLIKDSRKWAKIFNKKQKRNMWLMSEKLARK